MTTSIVDIDLPYIDFEDPEVAKNPFAALRSVAQDTWVAKAPSGFIVLDHATCTEVSKDRRFRTPDGLGLKEQGVTSELVLGWASNTMLGMDGEQHHRIRRLALPAFTVKRAEFMRPFVSALIEEIVGRVLDEGRADFAPICNEYVVRTICRLLGFRDDDWQQVSDWADTINQVISVSAAGVIPDIEKAILELNEYTAEGIERIRKNPDDSLGSALVAAEEEGDRLSPEELVSLFQTLLMAGGETTKIELAWSLWFFAQAPRMWEELREDPSKVAPAVEEILRLRPPFIGTTRIATEDVVVNDTLIPVGTQLIIGLPAANYDASVFEDPSTFDIHRFQEDRKPASSHLSFGIGAHFCLGAHLARVEMTEALKYLAPNLPGLRLDTADGAEVQFTPAFGVHGPNRLPLRWDVG